MKTELTLLALAVLSAPMAFSQFQYERLKSFGPAEQTGAHPNDVIEGSDGALYGTTSGGGITNFSPPFGPGAVFKLKQDGSGYVMLRTFTGTNGDGWLPTAALLEGRDGALYGTTAYGGITNAIAPDGTGTVFKLNKDGSGYTVLHYFTNGSEDGSEPRAALIEGSDGAFYGTTGSGGVDDEGIVFRLTQNPAGYAVLHHFKGTLDDGAVPEAALLEGNDGVLYGTMASLPGGTVFKLNKDGSAYALLHTFTPGDGVNPFGALVEGSNGALYGTASLHGLKTGVSGGTVFKLNKDGSGYAVLYVSDSYVGALMKSRDGLLYGTTSNGGDMNLGTIFVLRPQPALWSPVTSAGGVLVRFTSVPGSTNQLQRAPAMDGSWLTLTNLITSTNGVAEFTDTAPPQPNAFYRVVRVP